MQGQWRLIKLSGLTKDWDAVVANVLGFGTATMLAWHAIMHRLPYNRSLAMTLIQFCLLVGTNGLIVDAMHTDFGDKLSVSAPHLSDLFFFVCDAVPAHMPQHCCIARYLVRNKHALCSAGGSKQGQWFGCDSLWQSLARLLWHCIFCRAFLRRPPGVMKV